MSSISTASAQITVNGQPRPAANLKLVSDLIAELALDSKKVAIERNLAIVPRSVTLVTMMDGPPATLSWLGAVQGHRTSPLGMTHFGQSGDIPDLYRIHRLDADAAIAAAAVGLLPVQA